MLDGFIKISAVSCPIKLADCKANAEKIIEYAENAHKNGSRLIVFPRLCITGASLGDLFYDRTLTDGAKDALLKICRETASLDAVIVVGLPLCVKGRLYNCACVLYKGEILGIVPQTFIDDKIFSPAPDGVFDVEIGQFEVPFGSKQIFRCGDIPDFCFGIAIGADATAPFPTDAGLCAAGANIIINLGSDKETPGISQHIKGLCISQSARLMCAYVYVGSCKGESTSDSLYSTSCMICENGKIIASDMDFGEKTLTTDIDVSACNALRLRAQYPSAQGYTDTAFDMKPSFTELSRKFEKDPFFADDAQCESILNIQAHALAQRLEYINAKGVVIGVSGGLDSTLALMVCARTADLIKKDRKSIVAVTMPCFGTSDRTKSNAERLCEALGVTLRKIDIKKSVANHFEDIGHNPENKNVVYENAQARERTQILMDIANAEGAIVVGTGDLSELALGFATYNGDHMSMYGLNASLPKTLIRTLTLHCAKSIGGQTGKILEDIVFTPVSPELLPPQDGAISQKTEDIVGAYELHDFFIYYILSFGFSPKKIFRMAKNAFEGDYDENEIRRCMKTLYWRFFAQQYKRSCLPEGIGATSLSLSPRTSWKMPGDASAKLWLDETESMK